MRVLDKRKILASTITLLAVLAVLQVLPFRVEGASTGTVCIAQVSDTACPGSPPVFNGPLTAPNTLLRVPVMINNTAPFLGFDITVNSSDVSKLKPYGADLTGSIMPAGSITLAECIGGVLIAGSSCPSTDNPTTVHLAVVGPFGFLASPGTTGLLFTAIFSIVGTTVPGGVGIRYQDGCSSSSSGTMCVIVSNGTVSPVPEATQTGGFDNSDTTLLPYATLSTTTSNLGQSLAGTPTHALPPVTYTATSQNGFNTSNTPTLSLSASVNGPGVRPTFSLSTGSVDLTAVPSQTFTQMGSVSSSVPAGVYFAIVTATYQTQDMNTFTTSSLSASFSLPLSVTDYTVSVSPSTVAILPPGSQPVIVTVVPKAGFNTLVRLGVTIPAAAASVGIGATYGSTTISGGSGTSTLTVTTTTSTPSGAYILTVTSNATLNGFTRTHTTSLALTVGPPGFQITASPTTLVLTPGNTGKSTVTVATVNGFAGVVALSLTVTPSSGLTCSLSPTVIALNFTASGTTALSCTGSVGTFSVVITGTSGGQSHSTSVSLTVQASHQGTVIAVDPYATIDLARASKTIFITVNLTGSPAINSFSVALAYDYRVLQASSLDYSTNVFAQTSYPTIVVRDCLDGHGANGNSALCGSDDGPGYVSFAESILGGATPNGTQGNIFFLTLNVNTTAPNFSQIQIKQAIMAYGSTPITITVHDGYYTSQSCNSAPCTPPVVNFQWSPAGPVSNQLVTFNANTTTANPGLTITDYFWLWADTSSVRPYTDSGTNSIAAHLYSQAGTYHVTLTITESNGIRWSKTLVVTVANPIGFTISAPQEIIINPGEQLTFPSSVIVTSFNVSGSVTLSALAPPTLAVSFVPPILTLTSSSSAYSSLMVTASPAILPGNYTLTIMGTAGSTTQSMIVAVIVPPGDFSLTIQPPAVTMNAGSNATVLVSLFTSNINATVDLSSQSSNLALDISFNPARLTIFPGNSFSSFMLIRANTGIQPGTYGIFVRATTGSITHLAPVFVTITSPPDFTIQTFPPTTQVLAGSTSFVTVNVQRSPCCPNQAPLFNVTLSVAVSPLVPNGPKVSLQNNFITVSYSSYTEIIILIGPTTQPGNYTVSVTGRSGSFVHSASSTVIVLPPPVLRVTPSNGPVGTKVQVLGSGFVFSQPGYYQSHLFWVTFDDQFLGEEFTPNSSFTFTFNVPDAQPGPHFVKALDLYTGVSATAPFQVLATPSMLSVTIDTGSIYFPGDTAVVYVLVSQNGTMVHASSLQLHLTLIRPDGSNTTLAVKQVSPGLFKAAYVVPTTGSIGTYALLATAQGPSSVNGVALRSFEVKPSWLSSNGRNLASATAAIGAIGMVAFAWKKGYFKRKQGDEILA